MILQINHLQKNPAAGAARDLIETIFGMVEEGHLEPSQLAKLRIQLDWIQYKNSFREQVMVAPCIGAHGEETPLLDIHVDTRQAGQDTLRADLQRALMRSTPAIFGSANRVALEEFCSFRNSIAWDFNRLYWHKLADWEKATGRGYEQALPGGKSDATHPDAVADGVADFWTLLKDMERHNQLPPEMFVLEIGVGMGNRAAMWLDRFLALDRQRGTNYYPRLRFLLGDYSLATLERSRPALHKHLDLCSFVVLDASNPIRTLSFLRHKILHIHLTNVYDNLPDEELTRRDGRLYLVQVRSYLPFEETERICAAAKLPVAELRRSVQRLLEIGPDCFANHDSGVQFWQEVWRAVRLEERLVSLDELPAGSLPEGLDATRIEEIVQDAPSDIRFHLSTGAMESFRNTLPLLRPRGYLQVQDIFVTKMSDYRTGFYGPGKLDGSIVNWVNGVLLREVAERAGYDLHFAPFHYRPGSRTSVLYTTQRE
jgi:SAM-dependent methyltransferase